MKQTIFFIILVVIPLNISSQTNCDIFDKKINEIKPLVKKIIYESDIALRKNKIKRESISNFDELKNFIKSEPSESLKENFKTLEHKITSLKKNEKIITNYTKCYTDKKWEEKMITEYEKLWHEVKPNLDDNNKPFFKYILIDHQKNVYNLKYKK